MYLNDQLGDCVIACIEHICGTLTGNAGAPVVFDDTNTTWLYEQIGGYVPGNPNTDQGCNEQTALNFWQQSGLTQDGEHKIAGYLSVDATNLDEVKTALWLFENLVIGMDLPDAWANNLPNANGFTWDVSGDPDPQNGHCVAGVDLAEAGVIIDTWGLSGTLTWDAISQYCVPQYGGDLHTVLSTEAIIKATQKAPNGFDYTQLLADFQAIGQ